MFGLIYKEFIAIKKQFIPILIVTAFFSGVMVAAPIFSDLEEWEVNLTLCFASIIIMLMIEMFQQGIFEHDERKVWQAFICSTPHGIHKQILSKYAFQILLSLAVFLWCSILFICAKFIENNCDVGISFRVLQILLWIQIFFRAVENPFLIRFASKTGNIIRMTATGIVCFTLAVYGLFGDMSFLKAENLIDLINHLSENNKILWLMPCIVIPLLVISYVISCRLYLNSGENYDK